jgi:hypothetical protein
LISGSVGEYHLDEHLASVTHVPSPPTFPLLP